MFRAPPLPVGVPGLVSSGLVSGVVPGVVFAALVFLPAPVSAQSAAPARTARSVAPAETGQPPKRIRSITLTGNQPCPKSSDPDEIVVCAQVGEPYRIPKELRDAGPIPVQNQSWVNRVAMIDDVGRRAAGLPDTCSPVGSGGQTGCAKLRAEEFAADKSEKRRVENSIP